MFDKKLPVFLLVGLFGIVTINMKYQEEGEIKEKKIKFDQSESYVFSSFSTGLIYEKNSKEPKLIGIESTLFKKENNDYLIQEETLDHHDIFQDLYGSVDKKKDVRIEFEKINEHQDIEVLRSTKHIEKGSKLFQNVWVYLYRNSFRVSKIKIQSSQPFEINDKSVKEYRSFQIKEENNIIQNSELKYSIDGEEYKLLVKAIYTF